MESWADTLDNVPIIGTSRNAVEAVVALCQGNTAKALEKGAVIVTGLELDVAKGGAAHIAGTTLAKSAAKGAAKVGTGQVKQLAVKATSAANVEIRKATNEQRRTNKPDVDMKEEPKALKSKRGEHVINNNVLAVFRSVIDGFLASQRSNMQAIRRAGLAADSRVSRAYDQPMSPDDTNFIRYVAVAHLDEGVAYVDANSEIYGRSVEVLRGCCVQYMTSILNVRDGQDASQIVVWERILNREVARINDNDLYVDEMALHIWSTAVGARELQTYRDVKQRVAAMFQVLAYNGGNDEVIKWVNELRPYLRP